MARGFIEEVNLKQAKGELDRWGIADIYNGEDEDFLKTPLHLLKDLFLF